MESLVSIISIAFNCRDDLKKTMESVSLLKPKNWEYVVVDGGSEDGTLQLLQESEFLDRYISEPDKGIYDAMNKGVSLASGKYVIFLNAGDVFSPDFDPGHIVSCLEMDGVDVLCGNAHRRTSRSHLDRFHRYELKKIGRHMPFCHQSVFVSRGLHLYKPFRADIKIAGDYEFFLTLFLEGYKFKYIDDVIAEIDNQGVSNTKKLLSTLERYKVYREKFSGGVGVDDFVYWFLIFKSAVGDGLRRLGWR